MLSSWIYPSDKHGGFLERVIYDEIAPIGFNAHEFGHDLVIVLRLREQEGIVILYLVEVFGVCGRSHAFYLDYPFFPIILIVIISVGAGCEMGDGGVFAQSYLDDTATCFKFVYAPGIGLVLRSPSHLLGRYVGLGNIVGEKTIVVYHSRVEHALSRYLVNIVHGAFPEPVSASVRFH